MTPTTIVIQGANTLGDVPGLSAAMQRSGGAIDVRLAPDGAALAGALPGADVMLGWNFAAKDLQNVWHRADTLRWIHWCGAGVDAALFPGLVASEVTLTNARGIFDQAMAEYTLSLILAFAKQLPQTLALQQQRSWHQRFTETIAGQQVLVVGVGSIGQRIGKMLQAAGMRVDGIGRRARAGGDSFAAIYGAEALNERLALADYVILITPLTEQTRHLFDANRFAAMKPEARFINLGRGALVVENALINALRDEAIAGAALDVFDTEPLPYSSPFWHLPNVIVSPHMSGDFVGHANALADLFLANLKHYLTNQALVNIVDKQQGFVP
ncbi:MAG: D-2-hydroxyacid dehydrogenase [Gammaproteobacteria bacterium]|nr:D-2-hydroxyacid dehydrogenase [Gammaproteobacteria bacterium]